MIMLQYLGYALALGLLIGLERGWSTREDAAGTRVAGLRTFGVLGLTGGVAGLLPPAVAAIAVLAAGAILLTGYIRRSARADGLSATSAIVGVVTMLLGMAATTGFAAEAVAAAAALSLILSMRDTLHHWLRGLTAAEVRSAFRFAIIALVILPLAPDRAMGPMGAWNPHRLWLVVVLVSGLSFAGYIAIRRVRPARGLLLAALFGAVVSSTAVTAAFARRLNSGDGDAAALAAGIALASVVMFARVLLLTAILAPPALPSLALVAGPALLVVVLCALLAWRRSGAASDAGAIALGNPLEVGVALGLAGLVALLSLAGQWALQHFGHAGLAATLLITGFADVDAAILAYANLPAPALDGRLAGIILAGPVLMNTLLKAGICIVLAPSRGGVLAALPLASSAIVGGGVIALLLAA